MIKANNQVADQEVIELNSQAPGSLNDIDDLLNTVSTRGLDVHTPDLNLPWLAVELNHSARKGA